MKIKIILTAVSMVLFSILGKAQVTSYGYLENRNIPLHIEPILLNYINSETKQTHNIILSPPTANDFSEMFEVNVDNVSIRRDKFESFFRLNDTIYETIDISEKRKYGKSKLVMSKVFHYLNENKVEVGCKIVSKVSVHYVKKWGKGLCLVPEPTNVTKIACAISGILHDDNVKDITENIVEEGCIVTVKYVYENKEAFIEIVISVKEEAKKTKEEIENTINFLNTIEGLYWVMASMTGGSAP